MICDENEENNLSQQIVESGVKSRKISIFKEFLRHDKNIICLPRHSSFMIMHTFADWGRVRHNRAESLGITTVSTTKAHGRIGVNAKVWGEILSSNELLTGNVIELVTMKMRKKYKNYCNFSEF